MNVPIVRTIVLFFYTILLLMGLVVPSNGSHSSFHPKSLSFILLSFSLSLYILFFKRSFTQKQFVTICAFLCFLAFTLFWLIFGLWNVRLEIMFPFDQFKIFIITLLVVFGSLFLYFEKTLSFSLFLKTLLYGNAFYVFFKLIAAVALIFNIVTLERLTEVLGIRAMGMAIFGDFQRLQTSMDVATPFLIFFSLESKRFNVRLPKSFRVLFPPLALLSTIVSFSRVLIFIGFLGFLFYFCLHSLKRFFAGILLFILACSASVLLIGTDNALKMVEARLFSGDNSKSDDIRTSQIEALMDESVEQPLFGMGMGGYSEKVVRDLDIKHSYEVQWVAFLSQFGFLGLLMILLPIIFLTLQYLLPPITRESLALCTLWIGWIAAGFTNPFVISLTSGIMYSLFALSSMELKKNNA